MTILVYIKDTSKVVKTLPDIVKKILNTESEVFLKRGRGGEADVSFYYQRRNSVKKM